MNKRTLVPILLIVSVLTLAYAIYRSTERRITVMENGHEVVYGQPQHGLILGLCLVAATCIISAVALLLARKELNTTEQALLHKRAI